LTRTIRVLLLRCGLGRDQQVGQRLARLRLAGFGDRVLEVEGQAVGLAGQGLGEEFGTGAGNEQFASHEISLAQFAREVKPAAVRKEIQRRPGKNSGGRPDANPLAGQTGRRCAEFGAGALSSVLGNLAPLTSAPAGSALPDTAQAIAMARIEEFR
jgi:hypothetical protein